MKRPPYTADLLPERIVIEHHTYPMGSRVVTTIRLTDPSATVTRGPSLIGTGVAICRPEDPYDARRGYTIALGRAIKDWQCALHAETTVGAFPKYKLSTQLRDHKITCAF